MFRLTGWRKADDWGSTEAIPAFLGETPDGGPVSEMWFGDHPDGPTGISGDGGGTLAELIAADPRAALGKGLLFSFGPHLPYLAKLIAPAEALSLQVHPTKEIAREGYLREDVLGIPRNDPRRTYRDMNHKPEMIYALTDFEALVGFRVPRKARSVLGDLPGDLAASLRDRLHMPTLRGGLRSLVTWLFDRDSPATPEAVEEFAAGCRARLEAGTSPSVRADSLVARLAEVHPGDPGIIVAFLMNPVSLRAGEAVYIPPRQIHSYQSGFGIEVMAASDNVIRAGLTEKFVDADQLVEIVEYSALPPVRVGAEHPGEHTDRFLAQAQEFMLSVTVVDAGSGAGSSVGVGSGAVEVPGEGPRIVICTEGQVVLETPEGAQTNGSGGGAAPTVHSARPLGVGVAGFGGVALRGEARLPLERGQVVFVSASEGRLVAYGHGRIVQVDAP